MDTRPPAIILDVDGTAIIVSEHRWLVNLKDPRNPGYKNKNFDKFHELCSGAPANQWVIDEVNSYPPEVARIVVTARRRKWELPTVWSLLLNGLKRIDWLFMRGNKDGRLDYEVKRDILDHIETRYRVIRAYDDNPAVLALWRERGIPVTEVPGWEED